MELEQITEIKVREPILFEYHNQSLKKGYWQILNPLDLGDQSLEKSPHFFLFDFFS